MAKKQGKVKSISLNEVRKNMQVMHPNGNILVIKELQPLSVDLKPLPDSYLTTMVISNNTFKGSSQCWQPHELKTLVIEYDFDQGKFAAPSLRQIPLKYSQWEAAVNNQEVDSDKIVDFDVKEYDCEYNPMPDNVAEYKSEKGVTSVGRIIPKKGANLTEVFNNLIDEFYSDYRTHEEQCRITDPFTYKQGVEEGKNLAYADVVCRMREALKNIKK